MAGMEQVRFRPARATDVGAAVPLILSSGPDAFAYVFQSATEPCGRFVCAAFADGAGEFGYRNHVVGEVGGMLVAIGAGFNGGSGLPFRLAAARQILAYFGMLRAPAVITRGLQAERVIRPPAAGELAIGHLGVDAGWRGRGIGQALMEHLLTTPASAGMKRAVLDVATTNPKAQALYARLGFVVARERTSKLRRAAGFVPSQRRMERSLG